jgi:hypothetical protein
VLSVTRSSSEDREGQPVSSLVLSPDSSAIARTQQGNPKQSREYLQPPYGAFFDKQQEELHQRSFHLLSICRHIDLKALSVTG